MHIVIVGGGFGGVKTALELAHHRGIKVTLISDKDILLYYPALYGTATGHSHLESSVPLSKIFHHIRNVEVVIDTIVTIEPGRKLLKGSSNKDYDYDECVFALGVVTTYFGLEGLAEYSYGIKSEEEVRRFKNHLHNELVETGHMDKNYIVVGAGPTGVELAAALATYLQRVRRNHKIRSQKIRLTLVEAAPRILPKMSESASRIVTRRLQKLGVTVAVNEKVHAQDDDSLQVGGRDIPTKTVIWTSGVANHPFFKQNEHHFVLARNGKVEVDQHLQGAPHVYVIGDNANTRYSGLAQTALHDAIFMGRLLKRLYHHRPLPIYHALQPPVVIPVGERWALFEWGPWRLAGWIGSLLRRAADLIGYNDILPLGQALGVWHAETVIEEECPICLAAESQKN